MKIQNNKKKQYKNRKTPKETHTKQNKTKDKRERERVRKNDFFT